MTPSEETAINAAKKLLALHFDAFLITTRRRDEDGKDQISTDWHGALSDIVGLHRISGLRLDSVALDKTDFACGN